MRVLLTRLPLLCVTALAGAHDASRSLPCSTPEAQGISSAAVLRSAPDTDALKVVLYRTPFATTDRFRFAGDKVFVRSELNVGNPDFRVSELAGTRAAPATAAGAAAGPGAARTRP